MTNTTTLVISVVGLVLAWLTLVLSIFAAAWLNQRSLERQMDSLKDALKAEMSELRNEIKHVADRLDARIVAPGGRL